MHHLQSRRFSGDGPRANARIRTPPGPRKGALQSLQRGGDGKAPQIRRITWRRGKLPVSILSHISSGVGLAIGQDATRDSWTSRPPEVPANLWWGEHMFVLG